MPTYGTIVPCLGHICALLGAHLCHLRSNYAEREVNSLTFRCAFLFLTEIIIDDSIYF